METIKKRSDFVRTYKQGGKLNSSLWVLFYLENVEGKRRFGFTVSKKIGKACVRNKVRRRLKEAVRLMLKEHEEIAGYDVVIVAKRGLRDVAFSRICTKLQRDFSKIGLL